MDLLEVKAQSIGSYRFVNVQAIVDCIVAFSSQQGLLAAQNFTMPAMSPTMTEGNIASWKVKEGEELEFHVEYAYVQ